MINQSAQEMSLAQSKISYCTTAYVSICVPMGKHITSLTLREVECLPNKRVGRQENGGSGGILGFAKS